MFNKLLGGNRKKQPPPEPKPKPAPAVGFTDGFNPSVRQGPSGTTGRTGSKAAQPYERIAWVPPQPNTEMSSHTPNAASNNRNVPSQTRVSGGSQDTLMQQVMAAEREAALNNTQSPMPTRKQHHRPPHGQDAARNNHNPARTPPRNTTKHAFVPPPQPSVAVKNPTPTATTSSYPQRNRPTHKPSPGIDAGGVPQKPPSRPPQQHSEQAHQSMNRNQSVQRRDPNAKFEDLYTKGADLGKGAFATVYIGKHKRTGNEYAVKQIDRSKMQWSGRDALQDEINNLRALVGAPHIIQLIDVFEQAHWCLLIMEILPGGELFARIIQKGVFTEAEARDSCKCVLLALSHMHRKRMVHRDLKPENLLLADPFDTAKVKLSDFGFSKKVEKPNACRTLCGTPGYLAPEILERWPAYDVPCDTWSFGVILFLLLGGYLPFDAHGSNDVNAVFERTRNGDYHFYPERWKDISHKAKDLVAKCLTVSPQKRIKIDAALQHDWMAGLAPPKIVLSVASLASTVMQVEQNKQRQKQRQQHQHHPGPNKQGQGEVDRMQELNDDFTVFMEGQKGDSLVSHYTAAKTVATKATIQFQEEGSSGKPFLNCYRVKDKLGQGGFASVYQCQNQRTGSSYAVKEIDMTKLNAAEKAILNDEITVLKFLRGAPYIIRLFDVFREPGKTYLVLEEMKGGDLMHRICDKEVYTEREARELCKVLFHAVDYCHKKQIAHRDIKLDNLLLVEPNDDSTIKLADFGFAKRVTKPLGLKTICGTPSYMAPEILDWNVKGYDYRCDNWSVGVVVYALLGGYLPFEGTMQELAKLVPKGEIHFHTVYWKDTTKEARQMIACLLKTNPDERYTAAEALGCKWMGMDDEELGTVDLSATQEKIREETKKTDGIHKFKTAVKAVIGANKIGSLLNHESIMQKPEHEPTIEEEKEDRFEDHYDLGHIVGEGLFSTIFVGTHLKTKAKYNIKKVVRRNLHPSDVTALTDEISVMMSLRECRQVVRLEEVFEDPDTTYVVMQHVPGEVLMDRLIRNKKYTEFDAKELIRNLLQGISYCHEKRIANRNLKLENLLLPKGTTTEIMISDFEFAKVVTFPNSLRTQCGTQEYVAPEVLENRPAYDVPCDMWTIGVIVFIMLGGYYPFRGQNEEEILRKTRYGIFEFHSKYWKEISSDATSLIRNMLQVDPQERITAEQALNSAWIKAERSVLSVDLKDSMQGRLKEELEAKEEVAAKFRGAAKSIVATNLLAEPAVVEEPKGYDDNDDDDDDFGGLGYL